MECSRIEELLSLFIEGELSDDLAEKVADHLATCTSCRDLKEALERNLYLCEDLKEEVPFFLKNRLYNIYEAQEEEPAAISPRAAGILKWTAAMVGTVVLFLNLFFFTNLFPPANRFLHVAVSRIEIIAVEASAFLERVKESDTIPFLGLFRSDDSAIPKGAFPDTPKEEGGTNG